MIKNYCQYCGKLIIRRYNLKKHSFEGKKNYMSRKYCDRMCMRKAFTKTGYSIQCWGSTHATARNINILILKKSECELCGKSGRLDVHHKDFDEQNNDPENLQVLCRSCHMKIHRPKPICNIEGCNNPVKGYGYCEKHYRRYKNTGNPLHTKYDVKKCNQTQREELIETTT